VIIKYRKILNLIKLIQYNKYYKNYLIAKIENNCHCHSDELTKSIKKNCVKIIYRIIVTNIRNALYESLLY